MSTVEQVGIAFAGRYTIERELGRGGFATVYLARDVKYGRAVAVKVLHPERTAAVEGERFLREIRFTAAFNHPHILPLLDSGEAGGLLYYVTPYVAAGSLRQRLQAGPLPLADTLRITAEAAAALDYAHRHGVLHRDVKPENILLSEGVAVVGDFGLARALQPDGEALTRTAFPLGTPGYMSPEQALGQDELGAATDVYGLTCVAYEMLVGAPPAFWVTEDVLRLGRFRDAPPSHRAQLDRLPGRIEQVLARGLALRAADRFASPGALAAALAAATVPGAWLDDENVRAVLTRAATLDAQAPSAAPALLSIGTVEQIAAEVGIAPQHVQAALRETAPQPAGGGQVVVPSPVGLAPPGMAELYSEREQRILIEERLPSRLVRDAYPAIVHEIQETLGVVGHVSEVGGMLTWSPAAQVPAGCRAVVALTAVGEATSLRIEERIELEGIRVAAAPLGTITGALIGVAFSAFVDPLLPVFALGGGLLGGFVGVRTTLWYAASRRLPRLLELKQRLRALLDRPRH